MTKRSTDREKDKDREKERKRSRSRSPSTSARDRDRDRKRGREELGYEEWEKLRKERKERRKEESLRKVGIWKSVVFCIVLECGGDTANQRLGRAGEEKGEAVCERRREG